jgi:EAL domain-containing protein (putative c-di-GMP-specific phosphodiesterase class I)
VYARTKLEDELRRAVSVGEFEVYYQPVVALCDGGLAGFEALARWRHPRRGVLATSEFIRVAEETRLIADIGAWVLFESCRQVSEWRELLRPDEALNISVNVSASQLACAGFVERVGWTLSETKLPPRCLKLEINEGALKTNERALADSLARLRALGVRLTLDDFGTGFSSPNRLRRLHFDTLKIDRTLVARARAHDREARAVRDDACAVGEALALASRLRMTAVAEGVETDEQRARLVALGCEYAQGFLYSEPVAAEDALALIRRNSRTNAARDFNSHAADRSLSRLTQILAA